MRIRGPFRGLTGNSGLNVYIIDRIKGLPLTGLDEKQEFDQVDQPDKNKGPCIKGHQFPIRCKSPIA